MLIALMLIAAPAQDLNPPRVDHEPPVAVDAEGNWRLWFRVRDESPLFGAAVYTATADGGWVSAEPKEVAPGWLEAVVPQAPGLRYFFEVFDAQGNGPTRVGSSEVPFVLPTPTGVLGPSRPWDAPVVVPNPIKPPEPAWWEEPIVQRAAVGAGLAAAVSGVVYGSYLLLRARPKSTVTLFPVGAEVLP